MQVLQRTRARPRVNKEETFNPKDFLNIIKQREHKWYPLTFWEKNCFKQYWKGYQIFIKFPIYIESVPGALEESKLFTIFH